MSEFSDPSWKDVRGLAPALVDSCKKLWERVASRRAPSATPRGSAQPAPGPTADSLAAAEVRLHVLEQRVADLEEEAASSFDVVRSTTQQQSQLAEQHAELVRATDALLGRTRMLTWVAAALAVSLIAILAIAIAR